MEYYVKIDSPKIMQNLQKLLFANTYIWYFSRTRAYQFLKSKSLVFDTNTHTFTTYANGHTVPTQTITLRKARKIIRETS